MFDEAGSDNPVSVQDEVGQDAVVSAPSHNIAILPESACATLIDRCGKTFRRTTTVRMVQMREPFAVSTLHGVVDGAAGDWLAEESDLGEYAVISNKAKEEMFYSPRKRSPKKAQPQAANSGDQA